MSFHGENALLNSEKSNGEGKVIQLRRYRPLQGAGNDPFLSCGAVEDRFTVLVEVEVDNPELHVEHERRLGVGRCRWAPLIAAQFNRAGRLRSLLIAENCFDSFHGSEKLISTIHIAESPSQTNASLT